jgi:elongation factor G
VKQSGGAGQYAVAWIEAEPLPRGSGFEYVDKIFGGSVPSQYIPSVEKGIHKQLETGVVTPNPMVDIRVTLVSVTPHPSADRTPRPDEYRITLSIERP